MNTYATPRSATKDMGPAYKQNALLAATKIFHANPASMRPEYKQNAIWAVKKVFSSELGPKADAYTADVVQSQYQIYKQYALSREQVSREARVHIRMPGIPEDISENIIKFILNRHRADQTRWDCTTGDLWSEREGKQECKCFTSDGPSSFTPTTVWDVIYFLDARQWRADQFTLHRVSLSNQSDTWKNIKVNKTQTFFDHTQNGRRPRISWTHLFPQIQDHCEQVFQGSLKDIFS